MIIIQRPEERQENFIMLENKEENSMNDFMEQINASMKRISVGDMLKGRVISVAENEVIVNIGFITDGIVPKREVTEDENVDLAEMFKPDDEIDVCVTKINDGEGNVLLSKIEADRIKVWDDFENSVNSGTTLNVKVKEAVKGGAVAYIKGIRAFIPVSQLSLGYVKDVNEFVGRTLEVKVIELDRSKERVVLSAKEVEKVEAEAKKAALLDSIKKGEKRTGVVTKLMKFGAFVDLGGVEGLIPLSELSWKRIRNASEVVAVGDKVEVYVLDVDRERERISLALKDVAKDPWNTVTDKYEIGKVYEGTVMKIISIGAFVELEPGVEGLVHISEISEDRVVKVSDALELGSKTRVRILDINTKDKRMSLSIKDAAEKPVEDYSRFMDSQEAGTSLADLFKDFDMNK